MAEADRVRLAHERDFILGRLTVSPARRALVRNDGAQEVVEHRVMQVLIALAKAHGGIVTRDELTSSCWDGRVVGEDAINRVISRLRKAAVGIGADSFKIETITKIGYRLVDAAQEDRPQAASDLLGEGRDAPLRSPLLSRRMMAGGVAAGIVILGGGTWLYRQGAKPAVPPEINSLMEQGMRAVMQDTREGQSQAVGLYRRVTEIAPDHADGWGMLGAAYAQGACYRPKEEGQALTERSRAATQRALELEPGNAYGLLAMACARPCRGYWLECERELRQALAAKPDDDIVTTTLGIFLGSVGRFSEAVTQFRKVRTSPRAPAQYFNYIQSLWGAGRIEELDRTIAEAASIYPTQFSIWFSRFYIALYSGEPSAAIALGEDVETRPMGIPANEFEDIMAVARAMRSRAPADVDAVMATQMRRAREGSGKAENALQFACALGRIEEAFAIAEAYYFGRGFTVPDVRFTTAQGSYSTLENRLIRFLFQPSTRPMRADPRFNRLVEEIGLERYWRGVKVQPDYRRG